MEGFSPLRFSQYAKDLEQALMSDDRFSSASAPRKMPWFRSESQKMSDQLPTVDITPADPAPTSNITGLQSGAFQDALISMRKRIADKQKSAVAKIGNAVASGEAKIEAAANEVAAKVDKEIGAALQEFSQYSNGGPA